MLTCGIKVTHDGSVAVLRDQRLLFCHEIEKVGNSPRHSKILQFEDIYRILESEGLAIEDLDSVVIDGWHKPVLLEMRDGFKDVLDVAPYRRGITSTALTHPVRAQKYDLKYKSYSHYATHVASAYLTSPFARNGLDSYVLAWDGGMFPFLYYVDPATKRIDTVQPLSLLLGIAYEELAALFPPFDRKVDWSEVMARPGKIMAYAANGNVDEKFAYELSSAYEVATNAGPPELVPDYLLTTRYGRSIIAGIKEHLVMPPKLTAEDGIATIQQWIGGVLIAGVARVIEKDRRTTRLCFGGGSALNIKWNSQLRNLGQVDELWIPPFPNDAGSSIGAAALDRWLDTGQAISWSTYSGPRLLADAGAPASGWNAQPCSPEQLGRIIHLTGEPVVVLHGRAELGPRALGHRSILAPATSDAMKERLNAIKEREWYRPVAPICLQGHAGEVFEPGGTEPFMLFEHRVRPEWRDKIPAVVHIDGTARLQTVDSHSDEVTYRVLMSYCQSSRIPVLCNTSANRKGSGFFPDVRSALDWNRTSMVWAEGTLWSNSSKHPQLNPT